jgi:D-amino peptidase
MSGASRAVMAHTFHGGLRGYWVTGMPIGEIWMNCYTAGCHNVPFVFLSGDLAAAEEARALVPEVEVAVVKEGLAQEPGDLAVLPAISLAPQKAQETIRAAASRAVARMSTIPPYHLEPPFQLKAEYSVERLAESRSRLPGAVRVDACTVEIVEADHPWLLI